MPLRGANSEPPRLGAKAWLSFVFFVFFVVQ